MAETESWGIAVVIGTSGTGTTQTSEELSAVIREGSSPLSDADAGLDPLLERIGDARVVLVGEASHGTHEFYAQRAAITRRLIAEKGFAAVAAEADWPDAQRVNAWVRGRGDDASAEEALSTFVRFPSWMWRNTVVRDFCGWLREHNERRSARQVRVGFYGLDLYSLHASVDAVIRYLDRIDPDAASRARERYGCFDHYGGEAQLYGYAAATGAAESCEDDVVAQLIELRDAHGDYVDPDARSAEEAFFSAEQNARLVRDAEAYYRSMFRGRVSSWNLRDRHMAETLDALIQHLRRQGAPPKVVVWAHNSHLGDARATEMADRDELNLGQLVRQRYGRESFLIGFTTDHGTVTAASDWDAPAQQKRVRPGRPDSYEGLFHGAGLDRSLLLLDRPGPLADALRQPRLERAIGVIYRPETERLSHYFEARLSDQFDAVIHVDETTALQALDPRPAAGVEDADDTFPSGL